jgi:hypothetical protein
MIDLVRWPSAIDDRPDDAVRGKGLAEYGADAVTIPHSGESL